MARYWLCAMIGRFIGSLVTLRLFKPGKVLAAHAVVASLLVADVGADHRLDRGHHDHRGRPAELGHVPDHLHARDRRPRPPHRAGLRHPVRRDRRRRVHPGAAGRVRRQRGPAHQLRPARGLLPLHRVVRPQGPRDGREAGRRRPPPADHFDFAAPTNARASRARPIQDASAPSSSTHSFIRRPWPGSNGRPAPSCTSSSTRFARQLRHEQPARRDHREQLPVDLQAG